MELLTIDCENTSHVSHTTKLGTQLSFPLLIPTTSHIKPTNDDPVLKYLCKFKTTPNGVPYWATSTIPCYSVVIDIYNCCVTTVWHENFKWNLILRFYS